MPKYKILIFTSALSFLMISCAPPLSWVKPGAGQTEFQQAKYSCLQNSQQRVAKAHADSAQYDYDNSVVTNDEIFNACMGAQGWRLARIDNHKTSKPRESTPQQSSAGTGSSACASAWNALVDSNQVDNVKILVQNDCNRIHNMGWKTGQGTRNPALCSPPWDALEHAGMLEQAKTLVKLDCSVMHKNGF